MTQIPAILLAPPRSPAPAEPAVEDAGSTGTFDAALTLAVGQFATAAVRPAEVSHLIVIPRAIAPEAVLAEGEAADDIAPAVAEGDPRAAVPAGVAAAAAALAQTLGQMLTGNGNTVAPDSDVAPAAERDPAARATAAVEEGAIKRALPEGQAREARDTPPIPVEPEFARAVPADAERLAVARSNAARADLSLGAGTNLVRDALPVTRTMVPAPAAVPGDPHLVSPDALGDHPTPVPASPGPLAHLPLAAEARESAARESAARESAARESAARESAARETLEHAVRIPAGPVRTETPSGSAAAPLAARAAAPLDVRVVSSAISGESMTSRATRAGARRAARGVAIASALTAGTQAHAAARPFAGSASRPASPSPDPDTRSVRGQSSPARPAPSEPRDEAPLPRGAEDGADAARAAVAAPVQASGSRAADTSAPALIAARAAAAAVDEPAPAPRSGDRVTLQLQGENGVEGRLRVALRGERVHATLVSNDGSTVESWTAGLDQLRRALGERGFTEPRLAIQQAARTEVADPSAPERGEHHRAPRDGQRETSPDESSRKSPEQRQSRHSPRNPSEQEPS